MKRGGRRSKDRPRKRGRNRGKSKHMSDNEKTIQSINTDPNVKNVVTGEPIGVEGQKVIHNFGEAMGQIAQAAQLSSTGNATGSHEVTPPASFEDAMQAKNAGEASSAVVYPPELKRRDGETDEQLRHRIDAYYAPKIKAALAAETEEDRWAGLAAKNPPGTKPRSAQHLFDELLPLRFRQWPEKAAEFGNLVYSFVVSDEGGGTWTMFLGTTPRVEKGKHPHANCTVELSHQHFMDLMTGGGASAMSLFMQGRVRISGDPMMAMKLSKLASLF